MKHSLRALYATIGRAGISDVAGFPARAVLAAIAMAEGGDPNAWVAHDPPSNPNAEPSSGLYQVNRPSWPEIYAETERVRLSGLSDAAKIVAMTELVKPILADALHAALAATRTLEHRGIRVSPLATALFVDAVWQTGSLHLAQWARRTRTGDPGEIVNPERTIAVEVSLRDLAAEALGVSGGLDLLLGVAAVFVVAGFALSQWKT